MQPCEGNCGVWVHHMCIGIPDSYDDVPVKKRLRRRQWTCPACEPPPREWEEGALAMRPPTPPPPPMLRDGDADQNAVARAPRL